MLEAPPAQIPPDSSEIITVLRDVATSPNVDRALEAVRELLGMEIAYATRITETDQIFETFSGEGDSFGVKKGTVMPIEATYCQRILTGRLPNAIPDVRADDRARSVPATEAADVGAFASVPLTFSDGSTYGTLCVGSHEIQPNLGKREVEFLNVFARVIADQIEREQLEVHARSLELQAAVARTLIAAVAARDAYTAEHSTDVVELAVAVADQLGLDKDQRLEIEQVALLHDIGKIAIPDTILLKPGKLTPEEWVIMRQHPVIAERIVRDTPGLDRLAPMIRAEHERWDGSGYPDGLSGETIPLASRITLACDAYHAMISDRPYRAALGPEHAKGELHESSGSQFDPDVVDALIASLE